MAVTITKDKPIPMVGSTPKAPTEYRPKGMFQTKKPLRTTSVYEEAMNPKGNWLSNADPAAPYKLWRKATVNPAGSALAAGALAAAGTYLAAPWLAKKLRGSLPKGVQDEMSDEYIKSMRNRMALLAALGVGGLSVATHLDTRAPGKSMMNWNYGSSIPKEHADAHASEQNPLLQKLAAFSDFNNQAVMSQDLIPLDHAKEIVANDKFLTSGQKAAIGTIFDKTPDQSGNASMADITAGAVRAGLGFAKGAIAGYALGKIFALPPPLTRAASVTGGLANALRTSGLIS